MKKGMCWALGDGRKVKFWLDNRLDLQRPLVEYATRVIPEHLLHMLVHNAIASNSQWQWDMF